MTQLKYYSHFLLHQFPKCRKYPFVCSSLLYALHTDIDTYIHNWRLQPFSQDYGLASHISHVECVNCIYQWRELQFNVESERQIFKKLFHRRFIYSQRFCLKSAERKSSKKYIFSYLVLSLTWVTNPGFTSNT